MKKSKLKILICTAVIFSAVCCVASIRRGPGGTGGGNLEEANFIEIARKIEKTFLKNPLLVYQTLGIDIQEYSSAINEVKVQCAAGTVFYMLKQLNKIAYFDNSTNEIYLDCESYEKFSLSEDKEVLVFHEYMRKLGREDSEYKISSHLKDLLSHLKLDPAVSSASMSIGFGVIGSVKVSPDLYHEMFQIVNLGTQSGLVSGMLQHLGGPIFGKNIRTDASWVVCLEFFDGKQEDVNKLVQLIIQKMKKNPAVAVSFSKSCR